MVGERANSPERGGVVWGGVWQQQKGKGVFSSVCDS